MAADKRDFVDFENFGGLLDNDVYRYPTIKYIDEFEREREWNVFVRLIKYSSKTKQSQIDWDLLKEKQLSIKKEYFHTGDKYVDLPKHSAGQVWIETGIIGGKITRHIPTYFRKVAFKGQSNQRNIFMQALINARSQYLKKQERSINTEIDDSKKTKCITTKYFPMLAKTYSDGEKYLKFPLYVQPKLDGNRCIAYLYNKEVILYSRNKKEHKHKQYLKDELLKPLMDLYDNNQCQSLYLDGEFYIHGNSLQDISSKARNLKKDDNSLEYHIYDCFYPLNMNLPFTERYKTLIEIFKVNVFNKIKLVETKLVNDFKEMTEFYNYCIQNDYEGAMCRNADGEYAGDPNRVSSSRSKNLVKLKQKFTSEFEIVGFTEGKKGKDKGALIWILQTDTGIRFNVIPKMEYQDRYSMYNECVKSFDKKYLGLMLTVEYTELSEKGVPLCAKGIIIRDYE